MEHRFWTLVTALGAVGLLALLAWVTPTYSQAPASPLPKLTVESCLVYDTSTFRLRVVNWDVAGEWRLYRHQHGDIIGIGYLEAYETAGGFGPDSTLTTTLEGTWKKQFLEGETWVDRNGAHDLSVAEHIALGLFCTPAAHELGDLVWYDTDQDGIQDAEEPGVEGIDVSVYDDPACSGGVVYSGTTGVNGTYLFTDVVSSTYCLEFSNVPAGWEITLQNQGADDTVDSDAGLGGEIESVVLADDDYDEDMGLFVDGSIGDQVWCDLDTNGSPDAGEGMEAITVWLYTDPDCDGQEDALLHTTESAGEGAYTFADLNTGPPGATDAVCYVAMVDTADEDLDGCNNPLTEMSFGFLLNADTPDVETGDFGFTEEPGLPGPYRVYCPLVVKQSSD